MLIFRKNKEKFHGNWQKMIFSHILYVLMPKIAVEVLPITWLSFSYIRFTGAAFVRRFMIFIFCSFLLILSILKGWNKVHLEKFLHTYADVFCFYSKNIPFLCMNFSSLHPVFCRKRHIQMPISIGHDAGLVEIWSWLSFVFVAIFRFWGSFHAGLASLTNKKTNIKFLISSKLYEFWALYTSFFLIPWFPMRKFRSIAF